MRKEVGEIFSFSGGGRKWERFNSRLETVSRDCSLLGPVSVALLVCYFALAAGRDDV